MRTHPDGVPLTYDEKRADPVRCVYCPRQVNEPHFCQRAGRCLARSTNHSDTEGGRP